MSVLNQFHPEEGLIGKKDLQIWNNEAFDNGDDSNNFMKKSVSIKDSIDSSSFSSKENQSPSGFSKSVSTVFVHQSKPLKNLQIKIVLSNLEEKTEEEIEIENEIGRLYARLESIRLKRADQNANKNLENRRTVDSGVKKIEKESGFSRTENLEDRERMVGSGVKKIEKESGFSRPKNLEKMVDSGVKKIEKESGVSRTKNLEKMVDSGVKKIEKESGFSRSKIIQRRGFSLGPNEIMSERNPRSKQSGTTPIQSSQNRRKSCFWKLEEIEEEKTGFSRNKIPTLRQAFTTGGVKKGTKIDDSILSSIQPKKLFGEQSVSAKKPLKPGRIIASRYNQATVTSSMRKKSLTESNIIKTRGPATEGRVKRKWEIPSEIVIPKRLDLDGSNDNDNENESEGGSIDVVMKDVLPRIKAVRCCVEDSGRDSGPAKRIAELVGKKSYFAREEEEEEEEEVCQRLSFDEEEEEEEE